MVKNTVFVNNLEEKVKNTIKEHNLLKKSDNIIVGASGGKDSTSIIYMLNKFDYNVTALFINLGIPNSSNVNLKNLKNFCKKEGINLKVVDLKKEFNAYLPELHKKVNENLTTCGLCGVLKRYLLNKKCRELKGDKLVTGHNLNDEVENILLNVFGGNLMISAGLGPSTGVTSDEKFVQRVKPLYYCTNDETREYSELKDFKVIYSNCPLITNSFRKQVRFFIKKMEENMNGFKQNVVNNFLKILPELKKRFKKNHVINYCKNCGEPSRNETCMVCKLFKKSL